MFDCLRAVPQENSSFAVVEMGYVFIKYWLA